MFALLILFCVSKAAAAGGPDLEARFRDALTSGRWGVVLGLMFLAGLATSLTPCVYPMIAVTVGVFGARQSKSLLEAASLSTSFVLGIAALFTLLGVSAAATGGVFGSALSSPAVLIGMALLFLALAASMFGAYDIDLPVAVKNRLAKVGGVGLLGAFLLGLVSSLIAAPCTGPVLSVLLVWVGVTGNLVFGAVCMFVYALGLGALFWAVGTFSVRLPKSGAWLDWSKSAFGIVMVVAAGYFVRDLVPDLIDLAEHTRRFLALSAGMAALGVAAGAIHLSFHDPSPGRRARKGLGVTLTSVGLLGLVGYWQALPPGARIAWLGDYRPAKQLALSSGRPMLVDFGASWCGACGELDRRTFADPRVVREAERFVAVRVDLSPGQDTAEKRKLLAGYGQLGLPLVVLHDSRGREVARLMEFVDPERFLALMRKVR